MLREVLNSANGQSSQGGSIALASSVASKGGLLQEPSPVVSSPRSVDKPSAELITSTGTDPASVHAISSSQDFASVTESQTGHMHIPNSTSSAALFPSTKSQLPLHIQPTQVSSGNLSLTVNSSASIPATASLPFPSSSPNSSSGSLQNPTLASAVNVSQTLSHEHDHPTASLEGTSTSQGLGQSFTLTSLPLGSETTFSTNAPAIPASMTTPFLTTSFKTSIATIPSLGGSTTDASPSEKVLVVSSLTDNSPNPTGSLSSTITSATVYTSELSSTPPFNTTSPDDGISTSLPSKTITIWAPTSTVTISSTKSLDAIIGGSVAAGVATLLLCVLFLGLHLIRRKYKKARDIAPSSESSASAFLNVRRTITPDPHPASYASQAQISTSTLDITLPRQGEGDNSVRNVRSGGSSFGGENYYNSVLEDFFLPSSEYAWSDHLEYDAHTNSNVGSLEAPGTTPLSRSIAVPSEPDPSQIGIAI